MFKNRRQTLKKQKSLEMSRPEEGFMSESSSDDEPGGAYDDLISLIKKTEDLSSDTDSDEHIGKPKRAKRSHQVPDESVDSEIAGQSISDNSNTDSESNCLAEESESEVETAETNHGCVFGDSDDEECGRSQSHPETDFFRQHFNANITDGSDIEKCKPYFIETLQWSHLQMLRHTRRKSLLDPPVIEKAISKKVTAEELRKVYHVRKILMENWAKVNKVHQKKCEVIFSALQRELFSLFNNYVDVCYSSADALEDFDSIVNSYCLHTANHVLRSRAKVLLNSARLKQMMPEQREQAEYRDQGITRPKVLILLPFKHTALKVVVTLLELFKRGKMFEVAYKKRFLQEFGGMEDDLNNETLERKPEGFQNMFVGNVDEHFRIGIALLRNSVRLYAPFYSSDIIVASPLGLRTIIGAEGEKHYDHDFLSSIEILIMHHTDVFLMQNWEHIIHILQHLNLTPKDSHGVDFSRVRNFSLDGLNKFYRQTISISNVALPEIASLFSKLSWNYKGCYTFENTAEKGSICAIAKQLPQVFHKLQPTNLSELAEMRFQFFIERIYKQYRDSKKEHVVVYVPQYFDFVRLRNFLRKEWKSGAGPIFAHINDYSTPSEAGKAKRRFFTGKCSMMLYTERFHFYNRARLRGIKNLVFYELPTYPQFYAELCNMVRSRDSDSMDNSGSVVVMYSKYDTRRLVATVGLARCKELQSSSKCVHMFVTGASR